MIRSDSRPGFALVAVLFALAAMTALVATLSERMGRSALAARTSDAESSLDHSLLEAERVIRVWLTEDSASVVLPPGAESPRIELMSWNSEVADQLVGMRITAYDQLGMPPLTDLLTGSVLRFGIEGDALAAVDALAALGPLSTPLGLDDIPRGRWNIFPAGQEDGVGSRIATHQTTPPTINVSTAPALLLATSARGAGLGGVQAVLPARQAGELPPTLSAATDGGDAAFRFVNSSGSWAFRSDLQVGTMHRSWWSVFQGSGTEWTLVQRLAIDA